MSPDTTPAPEPIDADLPADETQDEFPQYSDDAAGKVGVFWWVTA